VTRQLVKHGNQQGFVLLELLIALVIVFLVVGASYQYFQVYLKGVVQAEDTLMAITIAKNLSAQLGVSTPLQPGELRGDSGRYHWRIDIAPIEPAGEPTIRQTYKVRISVFGTHGAQPRFSLATVKLQ
jgi:general secretion pathway protein I